MGHGQGMIEVAGDGERIAEGVDPAGAAARPVGALLRGHRRAAGLTQEALAERAGLSRRGLQHLEAGDARPYPATLEALAGPSTSRRRSGRSCRRRSRPRRRPGARPARLALRGEGGGPGRAPGRPTCPGR